LTSRSAGKEPVIKGSVLGSRWIESSQGVKSRGPISHGEGKQLNFKSGGAFVFGTMYRGGGLVNEVGAEQLAPSRRDHGAFWGAEESFRLCGLGPDQTVPLGAGKKVGCGLVKGTLNLLKGRNANLDTKKNNSMNDETKKAIRIVREGAQSTSRIGRNQRLPTSRKGGVTCGSRHTRKWEKKRSIKISELETTRKTRGGPMIEKEKSPLGENDMNFLGWRRPEYKMKEGNEKKSTVKNIQDRA